MGALMTPIYRIFSRLSRILSLCPVILRQYRKLIVISSRWREIQACNDNACGESKGQNFHDSLLDPTFLIVATNLKAPIY